MIFLFIFDCQVGFLREVKEWRENSQLSTLNSQLSTLKTKKTPNS